MFTFSLIHIHFFPFSDKYMLGSNGSIKLFGIAVVFGPFMKGYLSDCRMLCWLTLYVANFQNRFALPLWPLF
jgi:hypothetical protein